MVYVFNMEYGNFFFVYRKGVEVEKVIKEVR